MSEASMGVTTPAQTQALSSTLDQGTSAASAGGSGGITYDDITGSDSGSETTEGFEEYLSEFKRMTELASARNLEMMIAQTDYGTMLSAAKMRVNPV
ncbi:MAG: hypothetical protein MUE98_01015 [Rhodobacteraceae bacterium]|jgi:hypothetical protein|nr:hypothetical protein [Paracoccaceae bacterium]